MDSAVPMRWETTNQQWWFATPVDWAAATGQFEVVRGLLRLDGNLLMKLTSLRRIRRFETVWEDEGHVPDAAKGRGLVARELLGECETSDGNILIEAGYGGWLLYTAAAAGDAELVRYLLKREPLLVVGQGEYGISEMLYAAARSKDCDIFMDILGLANDIKFLIHNQDKDATAYAPSLSFQMMNRAVHAAARGGCVEMLRKLLKHCLDVSSYRDNQGSTVLHSAASRGQLEVVEELLLASPELVTCRDNQANTALHVAAYRGHPAVVSILASQAQAQSQSPSLLSLQNNDGNTALHMAVAGFRANGFRRPERQLRVVKQVLCACAAGGDAAALLLNQQNREGKTALHMAVVGRAIHGDLLALLTAVPGVHINACDANGMTPVHILELNLMSGITSESLLKHLLAAATTAPPQDSTGMGPRTTGPDRDRGITWKPQSASVTARVDASPGTSFRSVDSDTERYLPFRDAGDREKAVEGILEVSSRRLSAYAAFDMHGHGHRSLTMAQQARRRLATLLGWSGIRSQSFSLRRFHSKIRTSAEQEQQQQQQQPKTTARIARCASASRCMSNKAGPPPQQQQQQPFSGVYRSRLSLRQIHSRNADTINASSELQQDQGEGEGEGEGVGVGEGEGVGVGVGEGEGVGVGVDIDHDLEKVSTFGSCKHSRLPRLCGNDLDPVIRSAVSSFGSPASRSYAPSPMASPSSLSTRFKALPLACGSPLRV